MFDSSFGSEEDPAYLTDFGRDPVTELHFEIMEALAATMADPYTREVIGPDGAHFNEMSRALPLLARPTVLMPPAASEDEGRVKVLHFIRSIPPRPAAFSDGARAAPRGRSRWPRPGAGLR